MQPQEHRLQVGGNELCWFEWGQRRTGQPVYLFAHATGFHARCWDAVVAHLLESEEAPWVVAFDARGHGRSGKAGPFHWQRFGADLVEFIERLELEAIIGIGHSMGGHCMARAGAMLPARFTRLLLVDPVILAPELYDGDQMSPFTTVEEHPVYRRHNEFDSVDEMIDRLAARPPYVTWEPRVLRDYCTWGLLPAPAGDHLILACPPLVEASVYLGTVGSNIFPLLDQVRAPVTVLRAEPRGPVRSDGVNFALSPTWPSLASVFRHGEDVYRPDLTHFMPMTVPHTVAAHVSRSVGD